MPNKKNNPKMDLYDRLKQNPAIIEVLEDSFANKVIRSGSFKLQPVNIVEIPDRKVLDRNMSSRYGISNISRYFVPMIVDTLTYRSLKGIDDHSFSDGIEKFLEHMSIAEGHVKKLDDYYISYICSSLPIDTAIEHEGVHAFMFNQNHYYRAKAPNFGSTWLFPISSEDRGWMEAVAWVSTSKDIDIDKIARRYNQIPKDSSDFARRLKIIALSPIYNLVSAVTGSYNKINQGMHKDVPFVLANSVLSQVSQIERLLSDPNGILKNWDESFQLAIDLKKRYGVKNFIKLIGEKTRNELMVLK